MSFDPYSIIKHQHITEKSTMLLNLKDSESNASVRRFELPKYVFIVNPDANKKQIAAAVEEIYKDRGIKVVSVNTINVKGKQRRVRGRLGTTINKKKAIVTLEKGDTLEDI